MKIIIKLFFSIAVFSIFIISCERNEFISDSDFRLRFSTDTVMFDTVFSTIGTATHTLKIYNNEKKSVKISSIRLAGGNNSNFRLNINGIQGYEAQNMELYGKDSMFIFIELTVDPTIENAPFIVNDSIIFTTNGSSQDVDLVAWGQNIHFIDTAVIQSQVWTNDKPYLIKQYVAVDRGATLTIQAGTQIHFFKGASFYVLGNIIAEGTYEEPIVFQGPRLEQMYVDVPGQWDRFVILNGSSGNKLKNVIIKNSIIGLNIGSLDENTPPDISLENVRIEHCSYAGIYAINARIFATNCLFSDCGYHALALNKGGNYQFFQTTVANFWGIYSTRTTPSVYLTNFLDTGSVEVTRFVADLENAYFGNCIIHGGYNNEIAAADAEEGLAFNYRFDNCLIRLDSPLDYGFDIENTNLFNNVVFTSAGDTIFRDTYNFDFQLDTINSKARNKASMEVLNSHFNLLQYDINGVDRLTENPPPDLGAFELLKIDDDFERKKGKK